jgi:DNA polymerase-4
MPLATHPEAKYLHADLDAFYASVEQRDDPSLRGRPVIVGGGVVLAASYEAKAYGVRTAMNGRHARSLCPNAVVVPPRLSAYTEASRAVFAVFHDTTPLVEGISIDEAFLDVGGLRRIAGAPFEIAVRLRQRVRDEVGLPISVGIATTKFLAKVASAVSKPDGLLLVPAGGELAFLHPLPVERLWGVGAVTARKLHDRGITTVGDLASLPEPALVSMLGPGSAHHLHALAHNRDPRRVEVGRRRGSVGAQRALGWKPRTMTELDTVLVELVERVTRRMRKAERTGRTVTLRLRFEDLTRATRSHSIDQPTADTHVVLAVARSLLDGVEEAVGRQGCTLLGLAVSSLDRGSAVQLSLPLDRRDDGALDATLDALRERFGCDVVQRAVLKGRDLDPLVPMLPD